MLTIRLLRVGKKNQPVFRIVVTDKKNPPRGGRFVEIVGFYNPLTKEKNLKQDRIKYWLSVGAKASDTVHNLLITEKIIEGKKTPLHKKKKPSSAKATEGKETAKVEEKKEEAVMEKSEAESPKKELEEKPAVEEKPKEEKAKEEPKEKQEEKPKKKVGEKPAEKQEEKPKEEPKRQKKEEKGSK